MPPVRWRQLIAVSVLVGCFQLSHLQEFIPNSDGWKPIIGSGPRNPTIRDEITQYRDPSGFDKQQKVIRAQILTTTAPLSQSLSSLKATDLKVDHNFGLLSSNKVGSNSRIQTYPESSSNKISPYSKAPYKVRISANSGHRNHHRQPSKYITGIKNNVKPVRAQSGAYSTKNEVFAPAPSSLLGSYVYFNSGRNPSKVRDVPLKQSHINLGYSHGYSTFLTFPGLSSHPTSSPDFTFPNRHHLQNNIHYFSNHNDEYSKNLVPPPPEEAEEPAKINQQLENNAQENRHPIILPENLIVQVPPPVHLPNQYNQNLPNEQAVDLQITKEKFNVFKNDVPQGYPFQRQENYNHLKYTHIPEHFQSAIKTNEPTNSHTYEVTERPHWENQPHISSTRNPVIESEYVNFEQKFNRPKKVKRPLPAEEPTIETFLPTPLKFDVNPTSASQREVSAVYAEINEKNRQKNKQSNSFYSIKEVSTHYPILGSPENPNIPNEFSNVDIINEITTKDELPEKAILAPTRPSLPEDFQVQTQKTARPHQRRRRPSRPRTTSSSIASSTISTSTTSTEPLHTTPSDSNIFNQQKRRRTNRYRTSTTSIPADEIRPSSHKYTEQESQYSINSDFEKYEQNSNDFSKFKLTNPQDNQQIRNTFEITEVTTVENVYKIMHNDNEENKKNTDQVVEDSILPTKSSSLNSFDYESQESFRIKDDSKENLSENYQNDAKPNLKKRKRIRTTTSSYEDDETTVTIIPENDVQTTQNSLNLEELNDNFSKGSTESFTNVATTSTTTEMWTTKPTRVRVRPLKNKTRPRFSVKDYRQRLNQYTSTTTTTAPTTEASRIRDSGVRLRFPNRNRKSNLTSSEGSTSEQTRFSPKEPRYTTASLEAQTIAIEKPVKSVNTRLRPFGRYRSTTTTTTDVTPTSQRASIKPNVFSSGRRPSYPNLKLRIMSKYNRTQEKSTEMPPEESKEDTQAPETASNTITAKMDVDQNDEKMEETEKTTAKVNLNVDDSIIPSSTPDSFRSDTIEDESSIQQRISALTSSLENKYNTPGIFKSVSATSRIIPSHFTISTEDPVLPIEAFFSNLKDGTKSDTKD